MYSNAYLCSLSLLPFLRCHFSFPVSGLWDLQGLLSDSGGSWWWYTTTECHYYSKHKPDRCQRQCTHIQPRPLHYSGVRGCHHWRVCSSGRLGSESAFPCMWVLWMEVSFSQSNTFHPEQDIFTATVMAIYSLNLYMDVQSMQMISKYFGEPMTFSIVPSSPLKCPWPILS